MNEFDFRRTVPEAVMLGGSTLTDYRLDFTNYSYVRSGGAADILQNAGSKVEGVAWAVPEASMKRLDAREGAPYVYARQSVLIDIYGDTSPVSAVTYAVTKKNEPSKPTNEYLKLMVDGGRLAGLPETYLEQLIAYAAGLPKRVYTKPLPRLTRTRNSYSWDYHDELPSEAFFTQEEITTGEYVNKLLNIPAEEWEYMTDEEIEAELEAYNWWSDDDYLFEKP